MPRLFYWSSVSLPLNAGGSHGDAEVPVLGLQERAARHATHQQGGGVLLEEFLGQMEPNSTAERMSMRSSTTRPRDVGRDDD